MYFVIFLHTKMTPAFFIVLFCDSQPSFCHVYMVCLRGVNFLRHSASGNVDHIKTETGNMFLCCHLYQFLSIWIDRYGDCN